MANSHTIDMGGIGLITLERSSRARRVIIYIRPFKGARVAVPASVSFKQAERFVLSKAGWTEKHLEKIRQYEKRMGTIRDDLDDINMVTAKETIIGRLKHLAEKHGFRFNRASVRRQRTRWGSCSHKNNISLNVRLVKMPVELMDYVILHELVHTRIHNHSREFWSELDRYVVNAMITAKRLRTNGLELS